MLRFYKQLLSKLKMYQFNHLNVRLILFITGLSILGLNVIASATDNPTYEKKQYYCRHYRDDDHRTN